jgi:formyltetrahydrofolate deformylase
LPSTDKERHFEWLLAQLSAVKPDLIVLARYMQVLPPAMVERYPSRIINIHPSLLPYHPGANAYRQAWEEGVRVSGCTAHFVTEQLDAGPVILQDVFHIRVGEDTLDEVRTRGQALESRVLSKSVQLFLNDELVVKDKKVIFRPGRHPGQVEEVP